MTNGVGLNAGPADVERVFVGIPELTSDSRELHEKNLLFERRRSAVQLATEFSTNRYLSAKERQETGIDSIGELLADAARIEAYLRDGVPAV